MNYLHVANLLSMSGTVDPTNLWGVVPIGYCMCKNVLRLKKNLHFHSAIFITERLTIFNRVVASKKLDSDYLTKTQHVYLVAQPTSQKYLLRLMELQKRHVVHLYVVSIPR